MAEVTVTCACGSVMVIDACRGKGAYRCPRYGCPNRVRLTATVQAKAGCAAKDGCNRNTVISPEPVSLCEGHLATLALAMVPTIYSKYPPYRWMEIGRKYRDEFKVDLEAPDWVTQPMPLLRPESRNHDPVVYFVQVGEHVKIGTTVNIYARFQSLLPPGSKVLLEMPGSYPLERELHNRFRADRVEGEWFRLSDQIKAFIQENKTKTWSRTRLSTR